MSGRSLAWRRAARGINLIGFGVFLLLTTQGILQWSFWADAARLWPVLLVALGLRLVVEKSLPWAVLISPLLIQGTLAWVALHPDRLPRGAVAFADSEWSDFRLARPEEAEEWTLDAELAFAHVDVAAGAGPGALVEGRTAGARERSVWLARGGESPRVRLRGSHERSGVFWGNQDEAWEIRLADDLPVRLDLTLAFCEGPFRLGSVHAARVELGGAFNDVRVELPVPAQPTRVEFEGAFNDVEFAVPAGVPVRLDVEGVLNGVDRPGAGAGEGPGYRIDVQGAFNSIRVVHSSDG